MGAGIHSKVAVIGAGASGLMAANLLAKKNLTCTLFESHSLPGGCASWFRRATHLGPCVFDVGATVVPSFSADTWWYQKLAEWNLVDELGYVPSHDIRFAIDGFHFAVRTRPDDFFADLAKAFPADAEWINTVLRRSRDQVLSLKLFVETLPQWPIESPLHAIQNLKKLKALPVGWAELKLLFQPFDKWLGRYQISPELRTWFEMNALISIQCKLSDAYAMYALFAVLFHSTGSGTFTGGMRRYFEVLLKHYRAQTNAVYLPNTRVVSVTKQKGHHLITDNFGKTHGPFDRVYFSCPRHLSETLIGNSVGDSAPSDDMWSAFVLYLVVPDDAAWTANAFQWHIKDSKCGEEIFASFSPRDHLARAPKGYRSVNVSHHEVLDPFWFEATDEVYQVAKTERSAKMLKVFERSTGIIKIEHMECATPRTWLDYTQRPLGTVGGLPLSRRWTLFNAPKRRLAGVPTLIQIGDTSFPGQSLYACALSAGMATQM